MTNRYLDEQTMLEETLIANNIKYERLGSAFWVYSDAYPERRHFAMTCRKDSDTWLVGEYRNGKTWKCYNQYISIILSMVVKFKNGEPY